MGSNETVLQLSSSYPTTSSHYLGTSYNQAFGVHTSTTVIKHVLEQILTAIDSTGLNSLVRFDLLFSSTVPNPLRLRLSCYIRTKSSAVTFIPLSHGKVWIGRTLDQSA